jgi:hypothetical protein
MASAAIFFGVVLMLFALFDLTVVLLRRAGRLDASRWPDRLFNWLGVVLGLAVAVLFFVRAGLG